MDVRLTMGGEPTFVSVDDRDGAEWNTAALGKTKRGLSTELLFKLAKHYGSGGFLHFGQGKWYPGEQLPRWALSAFWRADGEPCWKDPKRLADERATSTYKTEEAERFIKRLAEALAVTAHHTLPAFEDTYYYLWRERRLPINVDPLDSRLTMRSSANASVKSFNRACPRSSATSCRLSVIRARADLGPAPGSCATSGLFLLPGDSPMGYRLPLDALPWVAEEDREIIIAEDPFTPAPASVRQVPGVPQRAQVGAHSMGFGAAGLAYVGGSLSVDVPKEPSEKDKKKEPAPQPPPAHLESAAKYVRTALCVEVREGRIYVFMPPVKELESFLTLWLRSRRLPLRSMLRSFWKAIRRLATHA